MGKKLMRKPPSQRGTRSHMERPEKAAGDDVNDIRYIAVHEAGHAVSAIILGWPLKRVDIKRRPAPDGGVSLGFTDTGLIGDVKEVAGNPEAAMPLIVQSFSGPLAELSINPLFWESEGGDRHDKANARLSAMVAVCDYTLANGKLMISPSEQVKKKAEVDALVTRGIEEAAKLVNAHWDAIAYVANLLMERKSLTGEEVAEVVKAFPPKPAA